MRVSERECEGVCVRERVCVCEREINLRILWVFSGILEPQF